MTYSDSSRSGIRVKEVHEPQSLTSFTPINTQQLEFASNIDQSNSVYKALSSTVKMTPDQIRELIGDDVLTEENSASNVALKDLVRYDILEELESNSLTQIFLATDKSNHGKRVVIKILRLDLFVDPTMQRLFNQEAKLLDKIKHLNVPRLIDSGLLKNGNPFLITEYTPGIPLSNWIKESADDVRMSHSIEICKKIALILHYAHENGIVHRDLNPNNIMINQTKHDISIYVINFGVSKIVNRLLTLASFNKTKNVTFGNPLYMSPEQHVDTGSVDERTDIYALGIILYELICSQTPFGSHGFNDYVSIARQHIKQALPIIEQHQLNESLKPVHQALNKTLNELTAKDIHHRTASMRDVYDQLNTLSATHTNQVYLTDTQSTQQSLTSVLNEAYVESAYRKRMVNRNRREIITRILTTLTILLAIYYYSLMMKGS